MTYDPEDYIWIQFEGPGPNFQSNPPELCTGADLPAALEFIAQNPGWRIEHWPAESSEVYHANEAHHLGNL